MNHPALPAVAAAADNDLYRDHTAQPAIHRTAAGHIIDNQSIVTARGAGYLGDNAETVTLPDGVRAHRVPITDAGLDWYTGQAG